MEISYSKKKQELRHDPLVESLLEAKQYLRQHSRTLLSAGAAVLAVALVGMVWTQMRASAVGSAERAFGAAMMPYGTGNYDKALDELIKVANEHKGTPHAGYAAYLAGTILLDRGQYDEAIAWLEPAASRGVGFVTGAAQEALGAAYEGKGDYAKALECCRAALADRAMAYRQPALRWKMALLSRELRKYDEAATYCDQIAADTLASAYRQKAQNLRAEMRALKGS